MMPGSHSTHTTRWWWLHDTYMQLRSLSMQTTQRWPSGSLVVVVGGHVAGVVHAGLLLLLLLDLDEGGALSEELLKEGSRVSGCLLAVVIPITTHGDCVVGHIVFIADRFASLSHSSINDSSSLSSS